MDAPIKTKYADIYLKNLPTVDNLLKSWRTVRRGKIKKEDVIEFILYDQPSYEWAVGYIDRKVTDLPRITVFRIKK
jgi:hypothetical protein